MSAISRVASKFGVALRRVRSGKPLREKPADIGAVLVAEGFSRSHLITASDRWLERHPALSFPSSVPARFLGAGPDELVLGASREGEEKVYPTSTLRQS